MSDYTFTKLFNSITKSTVWCEPHTTLRVWICLLADCNRDGEVHASIPGLANLARVTVAECEAAIATFLAPDPYSRTPDNEGRRIESILGGWRLLNHALYRDKRDDGARRDQNREAQRRHRQHSSADLLTDADKQEKSANRSADSSAHTDTDTEAYTEQSQKLSAQPSVSRFDDFWAAYPKKVGKKPAEQKWRSRKLDAIADRLIADVLNRAANDDGWLRGYVPDPCTYLNQERWGDELRTAPVARAGPPAAPGKQMQGLMTLEAMKSGNRVVTGRNPDGLAEALPALPGPDSRR